MFNNTDLIEKMLASNKSYLFKQVALDEIFTLANFFALLDVVITILLFWLFLVLSNKFVRKVFAKVIEKAKNNDVKKQFSTIRLVVMSIIDTVLVSIAILHILNRLGIDIRPILATAGVLGVTIGLGAKQYIEDVIAGICLLFEGQVRVNDVVEIDGKTGTVEKINLRLIVLRDIKGAVYFFRNGTISNVKNYTMDYAYAFFDLGISYNEDVSHVIDVIKQTFAQFRAQSEYGKYILDEIEILGLNEFADSAVIIQFRIKSSSSHQWFIKREFNAAIKKKFDETGIEIPFPQRVVTLLNADK